jgi:hypothetical protein
LTNCTLSVPDRKLFDLQELISIVLQNCCTIRARTLAKVCGKIIAMSPALGHVTQIMTRCMFSVLNEQSHWNQILNIAHKQDCVSELLFWKSNILKLEPQSLLQSHQAMIYTQTQAILQLQDLLKILIWLCINHGFRLKLPRVLLGEKSKRLNCVC